MTSITAITAPAVQSRGRLRGRLRGASPKVDLDRLHLEKIMGVVVGDPNKAVAPDMSQVTQELDPRDVAVVDEHVLKGVRVFICVLLVLNDPRHVIAIQRAYNTRDLKGCCLAILGWPASSRWHVPNRILGQHSSRSSLGLRFLSSLWGFPGCPWDWAAVPQSLLLAAPLRSLLYQSKHRPLPLLPTMNITVYREPRRARSPNLTQQSHERVTGLNKLAPRRRLILMTRSSSNELVGPGAYQLERNAVPARGKEVVFCT